MNLLTLSEVEEMELAEKEAIISDGLATFEKVGRALAFIRDGRLYRKNFDNFGHYCEARWNLTDRRARQLIGAVEIVDEMVAHAEASGNKISDSEKPKTAAHAQALSSVEPAKRFEVYKDACEQNSGNPTVDQIKAVASESKPSATACLKKFNFGKKLENLTESISKLDQVAADEAEHLAIAETLEVLAAEIREKLTKTSKQLTEKAA